MEQLGTYIKGARKNQRLTLRDVQARTGISNPYLSQLENGKIRKPSPEILHKLAECYGVEYEHLLELSGHPMPKGRISAQPMRRTSSKLGDLTEEEEEKLAEYLQFLRSRNSE